MAFGPLEAFAFPGTYTRTQLIPAPSAGGGAGVRYPALIGEADETLTSVETMARGAGAPVLVANEKVETAKGGAAFDGALNQIQTQYWPIVGSTGIAPTNAVSEVLVAINGQQVDVLSVEGASGTVTLFTAPQAGDLVQVTYRSAVQDFRLMQTFTAFTGDTIQLAVDGIITSADVSAANVVDSVYRVDVITDGAHKAIPLNSTDFDDTRTASYTDRNGVKQAVLLVVVKDQGGNILPIQSIEGAEGKVVLESAIVAAEDITIEYFAPTLKESADILPYSEVESVSRVADGIQGGRVSGPYTAGVDYIVDGGRIVWYSTAKVSSDLTDIGFLAETQDISLGGAVHGYLKATIQSDTQGLYIELPVGLYLADGTNKAAVNYQYLTYGADINIIPEGGKTLSSAHVVGSANRKLRIVTGGADPVAAGDVVEAKVFVTSLTSSVLGLSVVADGAGNVTIGSGTSKVPAVDTALLPANLELISASPMEIPAVPSIQVEALAGDVTIRVMDGASVVASAVYDAASKVNIVSVQGFTFLVGDVADGVTNVAFSGVHTLPPSYTVRGVKVVWTLPADVAATGSFDIYALSDRQPLIGSFYSAEMVVIKAEDAYLPRIVRSLDEVEQYYGSVREDNPLALAARVAFANLGGGIMALCQVKRDPGAGKASDVEYLKALQKFEDPMQDGTRPCNYVFVKGLTSSSMGVELRSWCLQQSSILYKNECVATVGVERGTTLDKAKDIALGIRDRHITMLYPDSLYWKTSAGNLVQVGGEYAAAAWAGLVCSSGYDLGTTMTNKSLAGFEGVGRRLKPYEEEQVAEAGITVVGGQGSSLKIKMALTTDVSNELTREPRITEIEQDINKEVRAVMDARFPGTKFTGRTYGEIADTARRILETRRRRGEISEVGSVVATPNDKDVTTADLEMAFRPMFSLNWILSTLNVSSKL